MMKTINKFLILLMLAVPFVGFTGCSDDDDDDTSDTKSIAGTYKGPLTMSETTVVQTATISVAYVSETEVTLSMNEIIPIPSGSQLPISSLPIDLSAKCTVDYKDGKYNITSGDVSVPLPQEVPVIGSSITVNISGPIDGAGKADLTINVKIMAGLTLPVKFAGTKQ